MRQLITFNYKISQENVAPLSTVEPVQETTVLPEIQNISTQLNEWKKHGRLIAHYFSISGIDPTVPLGITLNNMGYKYNPRFKSYSKKIDETNIDIIESELLKLESEFPVVFDRGAIQQVNQFFNPPENIQSTKDSSSGTIDEITDLNIEDTKKQEITKKFIEQQLEEMATSVDEISKQGFIKDFLSFSAKFHKYSFTNQMLIWLQRGDSTKVAGAKAWDRKFGRQLREYEIDEEGKPVLDEEGNAVSVKPIDIFAPSTISKKINKFGVGDVLRTVKQYQNFNRGNPQLLDLTTDLGRKNFFGFLKKNVKYDGNYEYLYNLFVQNWFRTPQEVIDYLGNKTTHGDRIYVRVPNKFTMVQVYDVSQTDPIEGREGFKPIERDAWLAEQNEDENAKMFYEALYNFAKSKDIEITMENTGRSGGWSKGARIALDEMSMGTRLFATTVHEMAHSLLHFGDDRGLQSRQQVEIEAESVTYIVLKHFGFDTLDFALNYLTLFSKGEKGKILSNFENVSRAVKEIVNGIEKNAKKKIASSWYLRQKIKFSML